MWLSKVVANLFEYLLISVVNLEYDSEILSSYLFTKNPFFTELSDTEKVLIQIKFLVKILEIVSSRKGVNTNQVSTKSVLI